MTDMVSIDRPDPWPAPAMTRIPNWVYTDPALFEREIAHFFHGRTWSYVGLECEVPEPGSFKRSWIGNRQVVMTRDLDGGINVIENRCAHRGTPVCWKAKGHAQDLVCPYHQWSYDLKGNLLGLPFFRGLNGKGGMPRDFNKADHGMRKLRVATRGGMVWASFADDGPDFETYCGPIILGLYDRVLSGKPLELLGYSRQKLKINWKLYAENTRDPYHATILHSFFITFGIMRADVRFDNDAPEDGRHVWIGTRFSPDNAKAVNDASKQLSNMKEGLTLRDPGVVTPVAEIDDGLIATFSILPSMVLQQHANVFSVRHVIPKSVNEIELCWTQFGYADDDPALRSARLKQANLVGPAGYVSLEDGEVLSLVQQNVQDNPDGVQVIEMGGRDVNLPSDTMLSEGILRAFYQFYRRELSLEPA